MDGILIIMFTLGVACMVLAYIASKTHSKRVLLACFWSIVAMGLGLIIAYIVYVILSGRV